jgi:hypothetical protein
MTYSSSAYHLAPGLPVAWAAVSPVPGYGSKRSIYTPTMRVRRVECNPFLSHSSGDTGSRRAPRPHTCLPGSILWSAVTESYPEDALATRVLPPEK